MDSAQNKFSWEEFQEFKKTLSGFEAFWGKFEKDAKHAAAKLFGI